MAKSSKLVNAGADVALSATGMPGVGSILELLSAMFDPGKRRALDDAITTYVLAELPRMRRLLEERIDQVAASGCSPVEAQIIVFQVIEAQRRTLDNAKRCLLTNVLVNGLARARWDKARHNLMVRLASELEPEHVEVLREHVGLRQPPTAKWPDASPRELEEREHDWWQLKGALEAELTARGLLNQTTTTGYSNEYARPGTQPKLQTNRKVSISELGRDLLAHLQEPGGPRVQDQIAARRRANRGP